MGPHSYDPGILPSGVLWSTPISDEHIEVELHEAEASLHARHICLFDAFTIPNSLTANHPNGISRAIIESLHLKWQGFQRSVRGFTNTANKFAGDFVETAATIQVRVRTFDHSGTTFHFVSDPANTTVSHFAQIGRERNGVFF